MYGGRNLTATKAFVLFRYFKAKYHSPLWANWLPQVGAIETMARAGQSPVPYQADLKLSPWRWHPCLTD